MEISISPVFLPLYTEDTRYYFLKGGRGSAKSWTVADYILAQLVADQNKNVVCLREIQRSIKHSSKKLLSDRIETLGYNNYFEIQDQQIICKRGKGVIIFNGLQNHTADSIKSLEGFDYCWVEEAQTITSKSLEILTPTIRKDSAKLFFTYNPQRKEDPIFTLEQEVENKTVITANYLDNKFCPKSIIEEAENLKSKNLSKYNHIYLGAFGVTEGLIFENVAVRPIMEEEIKGLECLQGLDFGYTDPNTFLKTFIDRKNKTIYIYDGFHQNGLLNTEIAQKIKALNAHLTVIRADSSEPKSIMALKANGIKRVIPALKGKDSVNAGINYIQEFDIIINSHLTEIANDFKNYVWDVDKRTGKPTGKPNHDFSHSPDALRYAVSHLALKQGSIGRITKPIGI